MRKLGLLVMPLMTISLLVNCGNGEGDEPKPNQYTLTLILRNCTVDGKPTYSHTYIEGETIEEVTVTPNKDYALSKKSVALEYRDYWQESKTNPSSYVLSGLAMDDDYTIVINPYNVFTLTITLDDCTINGESTYSHTYDYGKTIEDVVVKPNNGCSLTKDSVDPIYQQCWNESQAEPGSYVLSDIVMNANYNIRIDAFGEYSVSVDSTTDHLSFATIDDKDITTTTATEDHDFTFKMTANNVFNDIAYKIPMVLSIYIGDSEAPLIPEKYRIDPSSEPDKKLVEATVTIFGVSITGNIKISGKAVLINYYAISVDCYGVNNDVDPTYPYALTSQSKAITFTKLGDYDLPKTENMYLCFDGSSTWINPKDEGASEYCEYNETTYKLTIKANVVDSNVQIKVRSPKYSILDLFSWKQISDYSSAGHAPYLFYVGEEKTVKVNNLDHRVRIIGFNHDELASSSPIDPQYAGITFEFANSISDSNGFSLATLWNWENGSSSTAGNYLDSNLRKAIDGGGVQTTHLNWYQIDGTETSKEYKTSVLDMIISDPDNVELKDALKEVRKPIALKSGKDYIVDKTSYTTKLFPLSYKEMTEQASEFAKEEGSTYEFYKGEADDANSNRIKWQFNHSVGAKSSYTEINEKDKFWKPKSYAGHNSLNEKEGGCYWLRSPDTNNSGWVCMPTGALLDGFYVANYAYPVAPAFCI